MYSLGFLFCALFVACSGNAIPKEDENPPNLKWPKKYSIQAYKVSITSGLVEDVTFWRTSKKSRVDYNKGAVKIISVKSSRKRGNYGTQYEIHPESTEEELNKIVCTQTNGTLTSQIDLEDILPEVDPFESVGKDIIDEVEVEKFSYKTIEDNIDHRLTLWASYDHDTKAWKPIRYEDIRYDVWLNYLQQHDIWDFYNYNTEVDEDVFDADKYNCHDSEEQDDLHKKAEIKDIHDIDPDNKDHVELVFNSFKQNHKKKYIDEKERTMRKQIFERNLRRVLDNNRKNTGFKLAINKFADRTPEEMKKYMGLIRPSHREKDTHPFPYTLKEVNQLAKDLPKNYDLRNLGVVTPVRSQDSCGSCWTLGTTSAVEGALARKNGGRLLRLANQALIDCAWGFGVSGCEGGFDIGAYKWIMEHGLPTEEEYGPYANNDGFCHINNMTTTYKIRGFTNVTPFSVEALKVALVNYGPLSVSIHATDILKLYKGGIFYDITCDPTELNHEVSLVGYGEYNGEEYWILKNSWGQNWGVDGYIHISVRDNNCGVTTEPTYVVL